MLNSPFNRKETMGREIPKPEEKKKQDEVELYEEAVPIAQQIENLRTKIALQERYNAALKDNMEETAKGDYTVLREMFLEVNHLRSDLKDAVNRERWAVNNALRTHRVFQLCLKKCPPHAAVEWMDDKLFDNAKTLNSHLDRLLQKRKRLEDSEEAVLVLEKWPIPGTLPWEVKMEDELNRLYIAQVNMKLNRECARVLHTKYKAIRQRLRDEKCWYAPIIGNLNFQLGVQVQELKDLEDMLGDAEKFRKEAERTLEWTEKEASANRKTRRGQFTRMKKEMQRIVQEQQMTMVDSNRHGDHERVSVIPDGTGGPRAEGSTQFDRRKSVLYSMNSAHHVDEGEAALNRRLDYKRARIETYNDHAAILVDTMKIKNLTLIPRRMNEVLNLNNILKEEIKGKEELKNFLIIQRDQLTQLFCVIRFTGASYEDDMNLVLQDYQNTLNKLEKTVAQHRESLQQDGQLFADLILAVNTLLQRMDGLDTRKSTNVKSSDHLLTLLQVLLGKLEELCQSLDLLREEVPQALQRQMRRSLASKRHQFLLAHSTTPNRFVRVADPNQEEEKSDESDFEDFWVPGRLDIKLESQKMIEQGLLHKGIAATQQGKKRHSRRRTQ